MGSVIVAATALSANPGVYSPQHVNNWTIEINGIFNGGPLSLSLARGFVPSFAVDVVTVPFGNEESKYAGRARFEAGSIEVRDYVDADIEGLLAAWYALVYPGILDMTNGNINVPSVYKQPSSIVLAAPDDSTERVWNIRGCWPSQWSSSPLDMGSSEQFMVSMTVQYDKAVYAGPQT